ncbi:glycosyltransferase [Vibrio sp. SCSIO 43136]|uniref:glycosyltransferase n=1 Tax=Vibrio sp. SCSIO 43136 TaxID=2819101 RepID=UPI00207633F5|nr:glycosyltransferase [Vibrio sp. SCSIO 43136]USD67789.1 glycosyltransferase [Vibrio sp. SCSIO 43136]
MNRKKRIVHVVQRLAPGGLECMVLDLLAQSPSNHEVTVVSLEGTKQQSLAHWPRLQAHANQLLFLDKPSGLTPSLFWTLTKLFRLIRPDVVHSHHIGPLLYAGSSAGFAKVPVRIHTEHDGWHLNNTKHQKIQSLALKLAKPILVADADQVKHQLMRTFNVPHVEVIKNGIDCDKFQPNAQAPARQKLSLPQSVTLIGSAGRLESVKGHDQLITALRFCHRDIHLAIAGIGSQDQALKDLAVKLNVSDRVHFLGLVDDMPSFYQSLNLFCLPSRHEGLPLAPLEAQACNTPTLVTNVGASAETICPISGRAVRQGSAIALSKGIESMLKRYCIQSPRDFVVANNSLLKMSNGYNALLQGA